jgi:hypothetical protein
MRLRAAVVLLALAGCTAAPVPPAPPVTGAAQELAWQSLRPAPSQRTEVTAAAAGTRIYVVGGYEAGGATLAAVEVYDTATRQWEPGPDLPVAVNHAMAASVGGVVHVFGGYRGDGTPSAAAFRLGSGGWEALPELPAGRAAGTAVPVGGTVYVAGGIGPGKALASRMLTYDSTARWWSVAPGPTTAREHLAGAAFADRVYTIGGRTAARGNLAAVEAYDTATGRWATLPDLPTPRGGLSGAAVCSGHVIAVGGEAQATFPQVESYDVAAGAWRSLPPLRTPRHGLGVVTVGRTLYTLSGGPQPGLHVSDATEALDLSPLGPCRSSARPVHTATPSSRSRCGAIGLSRARSVTCRGSPRRGQRDCTGRRERT